MRFRLVLIVVTLITLLSGCQQVQDFFTNPLEPALVGEVQVVYRGGFDSQAYLAKPFAGGNDVVVAGFDHQVLSAVFAGSIYYLSQRENGEFTVYRMVPEGEDLEVLGFDHLDWNTKLYYRDDGGPIFYTWGLNLYERVGDFGDDDVQVTGFDHATTNNGNGPYYQWDGTTWRYYTEDHIDGLNDGHYGHVFVRAGTEDNGTGSDDVVVTGISANQLTLANGSGPVLGYVGWRLGAFVLDADGEHRVDGFDVATRSFLIHEGKYYYVEDGGLRLMVPGGGDDVLWTGIKNNAHLSFLSASDEAILYANDSGEGTLWSVSNGKETLIDGIDNNWNNNCSVLDKGDVYYLYYDFSTNLGRFPYRMVPGTGDSGVMTNDIEITGFDQAVNGDFTKIGEQFYYLRNAGIYERKGVEPNGTGTNDTEFLNRNQRIRNFSVFEGEFYYADHKKSIWKAGATPQDDVLILDGSKVDGNLESFILVR